MKPWEPGTEFAGLVIESLLGRGGMSLVYRATDPKLGRAVALKIISPEIANDPDFRARFTDEARSASAVEHPNIVPIYGCGDEAGWLYIAMRLIAGRDLSEVVAADGPLEPSRITHLLGQVGEAIDAVHRAGMVHRDIKPANVLVAGLPPESPPAASGAPSGASTEIAYLTDFGVTRRERSSNITQVGHFVGTVEYASPEQVSRGNVTALSDVYSFAAMVHECLTGRRPFEADSDTALMYAHAFGEPPLVSSIQPHLPRAVDDVVRIGLAKQPSERFASCGELMSGLRLALSTVSTPTIDGAGQAGDSVTLVRERDHALKSQPGGQPAATLAAGPKLNSQPPTVARAGSPPKVRAVVLSLLAVLVVGAAFIIVRSAGRQSDNATPLVTGTTSSSPSTGTEPVFTPSPAPISVAADAVMVPPGVEVRRRFELVGPSRTDFLTTVSFRNTTANTVQIDHVEVINKDEVGRVEDIAFRTPVSTVEADPVVSWSTTIAAGATAELRYSITVNPGIDRQWAIDVMSAQVRSEREWLALHPEIAAATRVRSL